MGVEKRATYRALTSLRGVGACWVVLFHLLDPLEPGLVSHGYLGVDLFFILSGFIISHVHAGDFACYSWQSHKHFLSLRLARIYPLHLAVLLGFGLAVLLAPDSFTARYPNPERFNPGAFAATLLLIHNWGIGGPGLWNAPTWSLSAEWLAYLAFPLVALLIQRPAMQKHALWIAVGTLALSALLLILSGHADLDGMGKAGLVRMAGGFIAGSFLWVFVQHRKQGGVRFSLLTLGLLTLASLHPHLLVLYLFGFLCLIVAVTSETTLLTRVLETRPLHFLGDISFSLYLTHWPLIQARNWFLANGIEMPGFTGLPLVLLMLAVATVCWALIEVPARRLARRYIGANPQTSS